MGKGAKFNKKHNQNRNNRSNSYGFNPNQKKSMSYGFRSNQMFDMSMSSSSYNRSRSVSTVSPERRKQLEEERKKREQYEANFKCDFERSSNNYIDELMIGKNVYMKKQAVTFGMENRGNTCFFNSVM